MAHQSNSKSGVFGRAMGGIWGSMVRMAETNSRARQLKYYAEMSDTELAKRGLTREQIAHHVFRDTFYC